MIKIVPMRRKENIRKNLIKWFKCNKLLKMTEEEEEVEQIQEGSIDNQVKIIIK